MGLTTYYTDRKRSAFLQVTLPLKVVKSNVRNSLIADWAFAGLFYIDGGIICTSFLIWS